jgi:hypothetical protein
MLVHTPASDRRPARLLVLVIAAVGLGLVPTSARVSLAAADDEEATPTAQPGQVNRSFFDGVVFQAHGDANGARTAIELQLAGQLEELERVCGISDVQKDKIALAARGDMKRYFGQAEESRKKFFAMENDQLALRAFWLEDLKPLQTKLTVGLFSEGSLYAKTLRATLTAEQWKKYHKVLRKPAYVRVWNN